MSLVGVTIGGLATREPQGDLDRLLGANYATLLAGPRRFTQQRVNFVDGPSLYSYARLNPIVVVDPAGLAGLDGFEEMKVQQFCSQFCKGSILREVPSQFLECPVGDVIAAAKAGDAAARKAYKLLNQDRFRK